VAVRNMSRTAPSSRPLEVSDDLAALAFFMPMVETANLLGVDTGALLRKLSLDPGELRCSKRRIPADAAERFCRLVDGRLGTAAFHLQVADRAPLGSYDIVEAVMRSSSTVGNLLEAATRFSRLLFDAPIEMHSDGRDARVTIAISDASSTSALVAEVFFVRLLFVIEQTTGSRPRPRAALFRHRPPAYAGELGRRLGAQPTFNALATELIFDHALLAQPLSTSDPRLLRPLERYASECLERLPERDRFIARVRQAILQGLPEGDPSMNHVAAAFGMSPRTLQRKLSDEDTSYQQLLDAVRLERSLEYLSQSQMTIAEAASRLGFADLTSFHRAFKRWVGTPPAEYRRRHSLVASTNDHRS
jgi:AraC-like DNA-binding protein